MEVTTAHETFREESLRFATDNSTGGSLVSIVIPCFNEQAVFPQLRVECQQLADQLGVDARVEILLIDDGRHDSTWSQISDRPLYFIQMIAHSIAECSKPKGT